MTTINGNEDFLDGNRNTALCLLASGCSKSEASRQSGIPLPTINRWSKEPLFKQKLRQAVASVYDSTIAELVSSSHSAARELKRIIEDPDTSSRVKISAISVLFSHAEKAKISLLEDRLEALESALNGNSQGVTDDAEQG